MTISYAGNFARLLVRWKGSIWKSVWKELVLYLILYYIIRFVYSFALNDTQKITFEHLCTMFDGFTTKIPITFLLGFYVSSIVKRWWEQFNWVAWPDDLLSIVNAMLPNGCEERADLKRHSIARYLVLTCALCWRDVSIKVRKRFPTAEHLVSSGLMTHAELDIYLSQPEQVRWYLPLEWSQRLVQVSAKEIGVPAPLLTTYYNELNKYRGCFRKLYCYDWVCIPLVYTQVASLATYGYFAFTLLGRQYFEPRESGDLPPYKGKELDLYFPIFTVVQFIFFVGWFKVGQDLMRPFGTDDDDFELNYILDRHIRAAFALVNSVSQQVPELTEDRFWLNKGKPATLPHTKLSARTMDHPPKMHAHVVLKHPEDGMIEPLKNGLADEKAVGSEAESEGGENNEAVSGEVNNNNKKKPKSSASRESKKRWRHF